MKKQPLFPGLLLAVLACVFLSSCVSNKKLVIAQDQTVKKAHKVENNHTFTTPEVALVLTPGDILSVQISHYDLASGQQKVIEGGSSSAAGENAPPNSFEVSPEGVLNLPVLGPVQVGGLTIPEAEKLITEKAGTLYAKAHIRLHLMNLRATVLGEVTQPGTYALPDRNFSVLQLIGLAGGSTTLADLRSVKVIRNRGGQTEIFFLDLTDELVLTSNKFYLQPDDVIYLQPLKRKVFTFKESLNAFRGLSIIISVTSLSVAISKL